MPILCGGESDAALRRAALLCDGWVGYAYRWDEAVGYARRLTQLRREYGRHEEPFDVLLALKEPPSADLYRRAEEEGITSVMVAPWMSGGADSTAGVERFRKPIEQFAETVIAKLRS